MEKRAREPIQFNMHTMTSHPRQSILFCIRKCELATGVDLYVLWPFIVTRHVSGVANTSLLE